MLKYLHIENIAVIENADIDFSRGFTALTGETGAGKSIVIDSINAVLGERTSKELIRTGSESAQVSAVFSKLCDDALKILSENGIEPDEDGNVIITRRLNLSGKSIIKINSVPITAAVLREISRFLINIHGQHDNQALLNPEKHCDILDSVAQTKEQLEKYYNEFRRLNDIRREIKALEMDEDEKLRKIDLLKYQINEIESADIKIGENEKLSSQLKLVKDYEKNIKALNDAYFYLMGDDANDGAFSLAKNAKRSIDMLKTDKTDLISQGLLSAIEAMDSAVFEIRGVLDDGNLSALDANQINERLDLLHRLMLKYGESEEKVLEFLSDAKLQLESIEFSDKRLKELSVLLDESSKKLVDLGEKLSNKRIAAAKVFEKNVCEILSFLNMPNVRFSVSVNQGRYTKNGCDTVEFLISANAGEDLKPLQKIASGGELSRVMLAIKSVLSDKDTVDTLIFDEIDTGISGFAAGKVAKQLKTVSDNHQVICVTHLAQIAAAADNHLLIEKTARQGRTYTQVQPLSYEDRIEEIARIMSGSQMTENIYNSAKELLDNN